MRVTELADFNFRYFANGIECYVGEEDAAKNLEWQESTNRLWNEGRQETVAELNRYTIEKPEWFRSAERSARRFVRNIGLTAARGAQISLLQVDNPDVEMNIFGAPHVKRLVDAYHLPYLGIVVRNAYAELAHNQKGKLAIGQLLVHELVHTAESQSKTITCRYDEKTKQWNMIYRQGFTLISGSKKSKHQRGEFFTEGIAEYVSGLYIRSMVNQEKTYFDEEAVKSNRVPAHYTSFRPKKDYLYISGPDGFAFEVMAATLQKRGIVSADIFVQALLATHSEDYEKSLQGYRDVARYTNQIKPGLYTELQKLTYSRRSWRRGLNLVIDAAQKE